MFGLFNKKKGCKHFFKQDSKSLISRKIDWSCFDGNYGSEPDRFDNYLIEFTCVLCGEKKKEVEQELA